MLQRRLSLGPNQVSMIRSKLRRQLRIVFVAQAVAVCWMVPARAQLVRSGSGVEQTAGDSTLRVDALRPDLLRVRMYPVGHPAEDASWAVLPSSRTARVAVQPDAEGFHTSALRVTISADLRLRVTDASGNVLQEDDAPLRRDGTAFTLSKRQTLDDHFFGLGDKPGPLDRAGMSFTLWNTDAFGWQESTDPIYKSVPFFIEMHGGRSLGVLLDNTFRTGFDFGHMAPSRYTMTAADGPVDYYLLYGPEPKQVVEAYAWLTGPTPLPPLWSLGYQQSRYSYYPRARVEEVAARLRADKIPTDVLWFDIDYQDRNRPFTVDPQRFPDFPGLLHNLAADHFHSVLITDLHIADLPNHGYMPYDTGKAGDHFVKRNGADYVGPVWPGPSLFPDFTRAQTRAWWGGLYKEFVADGAAGFWNDMNEPAVFTYPTKTMPDDVQHRIEGAAAEGFAPRTATHLEIHNIFGMENSRGTSEGLLKLQPNVRPFVMTRASFAGGQRYAVTWTGDNSATWNHLRQTTPQLLNLGLSGFAMSGADVGGFGGSPSPDLLTRWLMLSAFQPIDRDHAAKGTRDHEPWVDGPAHEAIRRRFIEERYRLMPYLYTTAEEMSRTGMPIVRPLFLEFPHATADNHPIDLDTRGEFFFGPHLLVADNPSPEEIAPYEVHLPPGLWYDYWTGVKLDRRAPVAAAHDSEIREAAPSALAPVMVTPSLDKLPVYVRAGAIVPMQPLTQSTDEKPNGPLTLRVFAPATASDVCQGDLYTDDGSSFNFRRGEFLRLQFTCSRAADGSVTVTLAKQSGSFVPWWTALRIELVGASSTSASNSSSALSLEQTALGVAVTLPYSTAAATPAKHKGPTTLPASLSVTFR